MPPKDDETKAPAVQAGDNTDQKTQDPLPGSQEPDADKPEDGSSAPSAADVAEAAGRIATEKLQQAEQAKNPQPGPLVAKAMEANRAKPMSGHEALRARNEPSVTMIFPRDVMLTLGDHSRIQFQKGVQEVPQSLSTHQWLKRNGVKAYKK